MLIFRVALTILIISLSSYAQAYQQGMVVSEKKIASDIGIQILKSGGNAIDAAIAVGYALAVIYPCCGNIGGGGFMTIHLASGKDVFVNFREKAPLLANKHTYKNSGSDAVQGYLAVATPGTVLGFETVLKKYGTMTRKQVIEPAIKLAKQGYIVTVYDEKWINKFSDHFKTQPNIAAVFLKNGKSYPVGSRIIQINLAKTLEKIAEKGEHYFYRGNIAKTIVKESLKHGGLLRMNDFINYNISITKPVQCQYRGYTILSAPPPSSGGVTLCEALNILSYLPLHQNSLQNKRYIIEAMRYSFIDRNTALGDPDYIHNPLDKLLSSSYAKKISEKIKNSHSALPESGPPQLRELTDTTHYSVIDKHGNAVAVTYTINGFYGAQVIAGNTGFFLNNEMDDFATQLGVANKFGLIQGDNNSVESGKRPLSSMSPTIVLKNGKVVLVLGSPGGPRIITATLLTLINHLDYNMNIQSAVDAPRYHFQAEPNIIYTEENALSTMEMNALKLMNYNIETQPNWAAVEAIYINPETNEMIGANDIRRPDGGVAGY